MTQFSPPPPPGELSPTPNHAAYASSGPRPWSKTAIAGFVFSLLMCLPSLHALLGIVFALVGIGATAGGRRRGRGLAIAAILISIPAGLVSSYMLLVTVVGLKEAAAFGERLKPVFVAASADRDEAIVALRELASDSFNDAVSTEQLRAWLDQIAEEQGQLADAQFPIGGGSMSVKQGYVPYQGTFVNGNTDIQIKFSHKGMGFDMHLAIDGIEVGGSSPRETD